MRFVINIVVKISATIQIRMIDHPGSSIRNRQEEHEDYL